MEEPIRTVKVWRLFGPATWASSKMNPAICCFVVDILVPPVPFVVRSHFQAAFLGAHLRLLDQLNCRADVEHLSGGLVDERLRNQQPDEGFPAAGIHFNYDVFSLTGRVPAPKRLRLRVPDILDRPAQSERFKYLERIGLSRPLLRPDLESPQFAGHSFHPSSP